MRIPTLVLAFLAAAALPASAQTLDMSRGGPLSVSANDGKVKLDNTILGVLPGSGGGTFNAATAELSSGLRVGYGFNAGVLWKAKPDWRVGLTYRSKVDCDIPNGKAVFTQLPSGNPALDAIVAAGLPKNQGVTTTLHFPAMTSLGVAWTPEKDWTWELDVMKTQWSAFDSLALHFPDQTSLDKTKREDYKDSWRVSVGAEHRLARYTYRFGYYYDQAASPAQSLSPLLPDASRHGATLGLGWALGAKKQWTLDVYELALFVQNRDTEGKNRDHYDGLYKSFVNASGVGLNYHW